MKIKKFISISLTLIFFYYIIKFIVPILFGSFYYLLIFIFFIIFAYKSPFYFLILLTIFYEKFFQIIFLWIPFWLWADLTIVLVSAGVFVQFLKNGFHLNLNTDNYYFKYILLILSVVTFSIFFGSYLFLGEPPKSLIFRPRPFFLYFTYLYLCLAELNQDQIRKYIGFIVFTSVGISLLLIIDAKLLGGFVIFKYAYYNGVSGFRGGNPRIVVYTFMTIFTYFYLLSTIRFTQNTLIRLIAILSFIIVGYQLVFVLMTRQTLLTIFLTTLFFLLNLKSLIPKTFVFCTIMAGLFLAATFFAINPDKLEETAYYKIIEKTRIESSYKEKGNLARRINGIKFFYPYFKKTFFMGIGMTSVKNKNSPENIGLENGYVFSDLGIFSIIYRFGLLSLIVIAIILNRVFRDLTFIQKNVGTQQKILANALIYLFINNIIFLPTTKIFFTEGPFYYGIFFYIIYKLKSDIIPQEKQAFPALSYNQKLCMSG